MEPQRGGRARGELKHEMLRETLGLPPNRAIEHLGFDPLLRGEIRVEHDLQIAKDIDVMLNRAWQRDCSDVLGTPVIVQ